MLIAGLPLAAVAARVPAERAGATVPWENSLGMKFVPVPGTVVLFCIWETRVQDFRAFVTATGHDATGGMTSLGTGGWKKHGHTWENPGFEQSPQHPVCGVSWHDAQAFCRWLTETERTAKRIGRRQRYRLPTDVEWSVAVGLPAESGLTPEDKDEVMKGHYPWEGGWPPPPGAGNYAGEEADEAKKVGSGYVDGYARTAPVGSFRPNRFGIYDLGGNLWEWCEDWYNAVGRFKVLRGESWRGDTPVDLLSSDRYKGALPEWRRANSGFRVVLTVAAAR